MNKPLEDIFPNPPEGLSWKALDLSRIPKHVSVIMDGNGRWAKKRMMNRLKGHKAGIEAVRETIRTCSDIGVEHLTIYSFSTENWNRPAEEVDGLMDLFAKTMLAEVDGLHEEGVRVKTIGDLTILPKETQEAFLEAEKRTASNEGMTLAVAVNYGSRAEIVEAANKALRKRLSKLAEDLSVGLPMDAAFEQAGKAMSEQELECGLHTNGMPDPEMVIRTSGEMRLSNFLLWQSAYSEFVSSNVLWPDFDRYELLRCLLEYQSRDRRFGGVDDE